MTGFVARDADEYAEQAAWLLTHRTRPGPWGARGRTKARLLYRLQDVVRRLEAVYLAVLDEARLDVPPGVRAASTSLYFVQLCALPLAT